MLLTGARGSHGGGCDSGSSSSSSSGGGSTGSSSGDLGKDNDHDDTTTTGGTSTSGSGGFPGSTGGGSTRAARDVKIENCGFDAARGIVAHVRATNGSAATTYTYQFSVIFEDPDGSLVRSSNSTIPYVAAGSSDTLDVAAAYFPANGENVSGSTCRLSAVTRTAG
jgi:hypothetical protein